MAGALWKVSQKAESDTHRKKRDMSFLAAGVGGNPKTGIKFYGKGSASLEVTSCSECLHQLTIILEERFLVQLYQLDFGKPVLEAI